MRASVALSAKSSVEENSAFVDNMIRTVQKQLRDELGFREVLVASGEEPAGAEAVILDEDELSHHFHPGDEPVLSDSSVASGGIESSGADYKSSASLLGTSLQGSSWDAFAASGKHSYLYGLKAKTSETSSDASVCGECAKGTAYVSPYYRSKPRLLVIVPYREAGIWSRSICMAAGRGDDSGSMLPYLKKALAENYGVIILNPAAQACHPRAHVETAWDQLVVPLASAAEAPADVFVLAFSRGAQLVKHLLNYDDGQGVMQDRVKALALVEPSHYVDDSDTYFARRMLARRAVAWILSSDVEVGCKIPRGEARHGCVCVSAGSVPSNVQSSSGAWALEMVRASVFGSFAARCGEMAGITVNEAKIGACGICHRKLSVLNRRIPCAWCQVKYCSRCCEDKFVPAFGTWRVCSLCQSLPCLIDPRRKNKRAPNHKSPTNADAPERLSIFIRPAIDDDAEPVKLQDFEIIKLIGRGACGRVKLVRKKHGSDEGAFYAMKAIRKKLVIQRGLVDATNAERRILDRIDHAYIAALRYAFQTDAKLYLLSKYYPGGNLLDQMRLARRFSEDRTRLYAAEVALAIRHLHANDIIYRDLKLENVLVGSDGHVALTDFGMSKENMPDEARTSTFVGTYQMMAPEVFGGKSYSRAVDWWALGVMVYEMIDGRTPFNAKTNRLIKERIVNVDLKFSTRFTEDAKDFVSKLLTKDENERLGAGPFGFDHIKQHPWFRGLDWDAVERKQAVFEGQFELMQSHAKEYRTEDIFDTYMNTTEVPIDTPASVKSADDELFNDFAFNYMDGPVDDEPEREQPVDDDDEEYDDVEEEEEDVVEVEARQETPEGDKEELLTKFLAHPGSQFDISLLRPDRAADFNASSASSLSSDTTEDAVSIEQIGDNLLLPNVAPSKSVDKAVGKSADKKEPSTTSADPRRSESPTSVETPTRS